MSEIYRDRTEGAVAQRQDLLHRRRDELVTMPHTVRRVIVARRARIAAALVAISVGTVLIGALAAPSVARLVARMLPGSAPAPLTSLLAATWLAAVAAYLWSRARAEHRFAVAMSKLVLPGNNLDHDLQRLSHERPDAEARRMAHRLELRSAVLPVIAAAMVLPPSAAYVAAVLSAKGWPLISDLEVQLASATTWWAAAPIAIAAMISVMRWRVAVERRRVDADDPDAGSEMFTLRGVVRAGRDVARKALLRVRRVPRRAIVIATPIIALCGGAVFAMRGTHASKLMPPPPVVVAAPAVRVADPKPTAHVPYTLTRQGDHLLLDVDLPKDPIDIVLFDDLPEGWHIELEVVRTSTAGGDLAVSLTGSTVWHTTTLAVFHDDNCGSSLEPVSLHIEPRYTPVDEHATFTITPHLTLTGC